MRAAKFIPLFLLFSCAAALRDESALGNIPTDYSQDLSKTNVPVSEQSTGLEPPVVPVHQDAVIKPVPGSPPIIEANVRELPEPAVVSKSKKTKGKKSSSKDSEKSVVTTDAGKTWAPKAWPYGIGEKFELALRYGPIEGGIVTFEVLEPQVLNGETVLHYNAKVHSSKMLELFYKVDDSIDSWVGINDHLPRRQEIKQIESAHWGRRIVLFDQKEKRAKFYSSTTKKSGEFIEIKRQDGFVKDAQDVFGALYFYRFIENLDKVTFPIHDRWQNWKNDLTYVGRDRIHVPMGDMMAQHYRLKPQVQGELHPKGEVDMWVSEDDRKLLVKFKAAIKVGSITGELRSYTPGKKPNVDPPVMHTPIGP